MRCICSTRIMLVNFLFYIVIVECENRGKLRSRQVTRGRGRRLNEGSRRKMLDVKENKTRRTAQLRSASRRNYVEPSNNNNSMWRSAGALCGLLKLRAERTMSTALVLDRLKLAL